MHTVWHTATKGLPLTVRNALSCWEKPALGNRYYTEAAALIRKLCPSGGDYAKSGWSEHDVGEEHF